MPVSPREVVTGLVQIQRMAKANVDEADRLRVWMKSNHYDDRSWRQAAARIQEQIDCRACANCCRLPGTTVNGADVERLAAHLSLSVAEFRERHVKTGIWGDELAASGPCMFLRGNDCSVYEIRPESCRGYPFLAEGKGTLASRMTSILSKVCDCPIVFNSVECWKEMAEQRGFRRRR